MARFRADEADNYGGNGGGAFFALKNDKDTAKVHFMANSMEDITGYAVHQVMIDGKNRYVNCLREYTDPLDACPFCAAGMKIQAKLFIPMFNIDTNEVQIWERGKTFLSRLSSLVSRYNPLVAWAFEIERNGKTGDTNTTYEIFSLEETDTTLDALPEIPDPIGTIILDKSFDDMQYFADYGTFPVDQQPEPATQRGGRGAAQPAARAATPTQVQRRGAAPVRDDHGGSMLPSGLQDKNNGDNASAGNPRRGAATGSPQPDRGARTGAAPQPGRRSGSGTNRF